MAECHPVGFQWVMEAKARGATVIHVDPRFTRTSAVADLHVPLRAGHRHRVPRRDHQLRPRERQVLPRVRASPTPTRPRSSTRTSATPRTSTACSPASTASDRSYDSAHLAVRGRWRCRPPSGRARPGVRGRAAGTRAIRQAARGEAHGSGGAGAARGEARARRDAAAPALRVPDPQAALRPLHAGDGRADLRRAAGARSCGSASCSTDNSGRDRTSAFVYSVGWTQHTVGRAVHPHRVDPADAARQHRPARAAASWRCAGTLDPGLHRHPDAVQPAARLHPDAARARQRGPGRVRRRPRRPTRASGRTCAPTRSACSRPGGATPRRRTTTSASTTCPGSPAATAPTRR